MVRVPSLVGPSCFKSSMSLLLVAAQVYAGIPTRRGVTADDEQIAAVSAQADGILSHAGALAAMIQTRLNLAVAAAKEGLNPPSELSRLTALFEEPLVRTAPTTAKEDAVLLQAIASYDKRATPDDLSALQTFLSEYPHSGWRIALLTNLGLSYYHYGYFSRAISSWEQAWHDGRLITEARTKPLVDRAIGELIRMHARIGHADEVAGLLKDVETRPVSGPATEAVDGAKEGLWMMRNKPGVAYLCGPMALKNLMLSDGAAPATVQFLSSVRSGSSGFTLAQVSELAEQAKLPNQLVFRKAGQPVPVPSVVHWKVSHFAAIVGQQDGLFHIEDPTFGTDLWVTPAAIDSEASGYFLVPDRLPTRTWRKVTAKEAGQVRGMGYTATNMPTATTPQDDSTSDDNPQTDMSNGDNNGNDSTTGDNGNCGMCGYSITEMLVSVKLTDTPVGYRPAIGPSMLTTLTYNQREASQPATFGWFNVSPKWTINWLSFVQDDPTSPGNNVTRYVGGGGSIAYSGYNSSTGAFTPETRNATVLVKTSSTPVVYQRQRANGGVEIFSQSNGATSFPRRIFLTKVIDPAGNSLTFNYDNQLRLSSIVDATGRSSTFSYSFTASPLLVTAITDPFGRSAQLAYDSSGRLSQITDVLGLTSQFTYDNSGLINALTTPYGTTTFSYGASGNQRFANATDPLGKTERVEYNEGLAYPAFSDPSNTVPQGILAPFNQYMNGRDTYYWNKHAYAVAAGDYTKARIKHWTHLASNTNVTADTVESIKNPLENRIWYNYPGQVGSPTGLGTAVSGTLDKRIIVARVLDDGTTQLTQYTYNSAGKTTSIIDPLGRQTNFQYAGNLIDLVSIQQKTSGSGFSTIGQFTYNTQHLPLSYIDAAGQTTNYVYNAAGEITQLIDALGHITQYQYDTVGRLTSVINANSQTSASFTYDAFDRVATRTDSEGYAVSFAYDSFDRLTQETFPDGTTRKFTYNKLDLASVTDRQSRVTNYSYDATRRLVDVADPLSRHTKFGYYENGKLKTLTDPKNNTTTWNVDIQDRVTSKVYADGKQFTMLMKTQPAA